MDVPVETSNHFDPVLISLNDLNNSTVEQQQDTSALF